MQEIKNTQSARNKQDDERESEMREQRDAAYRPSSIAAITITSQLSSFFV
jgi:hypothetical protein